MVIVNHLPVRCTQTGLTGDPEEVGTRHKLSEIKSQRPKANGQTRILFYFKPPLKMQQVHLIQLWRRSKPYQLRRKI